MGDGEMGGWSIGDLFRHKAQDTESRMKKNLLHLVS